MDSADGFADFFGREYDGMVRALTLVFDERSVAEDAAQVGFERALRKWNKVANMQRPGTWVYVVALRHGRKHLRWNESSSAIYAVVEDSDHAQATVNWISAAAKVRALPPRQRTVIVLRYLVDLSLADIGEALGIKVGTVKSTLNAAHSRLKIDTEPDGAEAPLVEEANPDAS